MCKCKNQVQDLHQRRDYLCPWIPRCWPQTSVLKLVNTVLRLLFKMKRKTFDFPSGIKYCHQDWESWKSRREVLPRDCVSAWKTSALDVFLPLGHKAVDKSRTRRVKCLPAIFVLNLYSVSWSCIQIYYEHGNHSSIHFECRKMELFFTQVLWSSHVEQRSLYCRLWICLWKWRRIISPEYPLEKYLISLFCFIGCWCHKQDQRLLPISDYTLDCNIEQWCWTTTIQLVKVLPMCCQSGLDQ